MRQIDAFAPRSRRKHRRASSSSSSGRIKRMKQLTLPTVLSTTKDEVDRALMYWLAGSASPLSTVEDPYFREFVELLTRVSSGNDKVPTRRRASGSLLTGTFKDIDKQLLTSSSHGNLSRMIVSVRAAERG